jgi:uncharacterized protein (DUF1501 family)
MKVNRRRFLRNSALGAAGLGLSQSLLGLLGLRGKSGSLFAQGGGNRALVVVNLFGGNDGLNTIVPLDQYDRYRRLRPTLRHDQGDLLTLAGVPDLALNPGMTALRDLFAQGKVAILNGVGVPDTATGLFDHSAQQFEFQTCDIVRASTALPPTGWLGRFLDGVTQDVVAPGIDMGGGRLMLTGASFDPLSVDSIDELSLELNFDEDERMAAYQNIMAVPHGGSMVGERSRELRIEALAQGETIQNAVAGYVPAVQYPDTDLGFDLRQCAEILEGDLGIYALGVGAGGYDTHDDQNPGAGNGNLGYHDELLKEVSDAIGAFYADLTAHGIADRVLILTISEFGRTPHENGGRGTDHGFSSVAFAVGGLVNGGVYGLYPGLSDSHLVFDGLTDVTTDFRSVYSTAFASFMGVDPVPIVGGSFPTLGYV